MVSEHGLITTVAWKLGDADAVYALEGSVAMAGALVQWLRDNLGLIDDASEIEQLARSVPDSGGVVFVPAFSGLFAPYWRTDARGVIVGLTRFATKGHIARAALEATAYQTYDLVQAMLADTGARELGELRVDGGMTKNDLLMQFQADLLGAPVAAPSIAEITAAGAAYAAGLATGFWAGLDELRAQLHDHAPVAAPDGRRRARPRRRRLAPGDRPDPRPVPGGAGRGERGVAPGPGAGAGTAGVSGRRRQRPILRRRDAAHRRCTNTPSALIARSPSRTGRRQSAHGASTPLVGDAASRLAGDGAWSGRGGGEDMKSGRVWAGGPTPASRVRPAR